MGVRRRDRLRTAARHVASDGFELSAPLGVIFHRGLARSAECSLSWWLNNADVLTQSHPISKVRITAWDTLYQQEEAAGLHQPGQFRNDAIRNRWPEIEFTFPSATPRHDMSRPRVNPLNTPLDFADPNTPRGAFTEPADQWGTSRIAYSARAQREMQRIQELQRIRELHRVRELQQLLSPPPAET